MPIVLPEYSSAASFTSNAELTAEVALRGSWAALGNFTVAGISIRQSSTNALYYALQYAGEPNVPSDIRRLRKSSLQVMRRMGQPVIVKHMFNDRDAKLGIAKPSPAAVDGYGKQVRNRDPFSYGTGFCSVQLSPNEWINPTSGNIVTANTQPEAAFIQAPMYRGYGPGYLTYIIQPDVAMDLFKLSPTGAIIKTQSQTVVAPWFPEINDNDLVINVELDNEGNVVDTSERFQAKRSSPVSIRGRDRRGRSEGRAGLQTSYPNRFVINQTMEMSALPETSVLMEVEVDR